MTQQPGGSGPDLIGEFQRWLIRSSARGVGRQVTGQIRSALGRNQQPKGDVWETATNEPPEEAPECAWCPLCRAARLLRETKPGRDTRVTAVSDALGTVVQDAFSVLEAALATTGRPGGSGRPASTDGRQAGQAAKPGSGPAKAGSAKTGPAKPGPAKTGAAKTGAAKVGPGGTGPAGTGPAKTGPAGTDPAGTGPAKTGPAGTDPAGTGPAKTGPAKTGPAGADSAGTGPAGASTAGSTPAGTTPVKPEPGAAAQGTGNGAAPESPDGSPREPDDRG